MLKIVDVRLKKGWSQFELARRSNIHPSDLSQLERGLIYPYPGWKKRLEDALNMPANELFKEVSNDKYDDVVSRKVSINKQFFSRKLIIAL